MSALGGIKHITEGLQRFISGGNKYRIAIYVAA